MDHSQTVERTRFLASFLTRAPRLRTMLIAARAPFVKKTSIQRQVVHQLAEVHPSLTYIAFTLNYMWIRDGLRDAWVRVSTRGWFPSDT